MPASFRERGGPTRIKRRGRISRKANDSRRKITGGDQREASFFVQRIGSNSGRRLPQAEQVLPAGVRARRVCIMSGKLFNPITLGGLIRYLAAVDKGFGDQRILAVLSRVAGVPELKK